MKNTEIFCEARPDVSRRQQRALYPFSHQGGVDKTIYLVSILQGVYQKGAFSGWTFVATHPSPDSEDVYRVCRPSFVFTHANPRATSWFGTSGTGERTDTARRASGDATASSEIIWMLLLNLRKNRISCQAEAA